MYRIIVTIKALKHEALQDVTHRTPQDVNPVNERNRMAVVDVRVETTKPNVNEKTNDPSRASIADIETMLAIIAMIARKVKSTVMRLEDIESADDDRVEITKVREKEKITEGKETTIEVIAAIARREVRWKALNFKM